MKYNKLISRDTRGVDEYTRKATDESRCSGRTTCIALRMLAKAIEEPGVEIELLDHDGDGLNIMANRHLGRTLRSLVNGMGLKYIFVRDTLTGASVSSDRMTNSIWAIE